MENIINTLIIQGIGALGFGTLSLSYFKKEKKQILFMQMIAYIFFTIHFYLLHGLTGAICNIIGLFATLTIYLLDKKDVKIKMIASTFFVLLLVIVNIMTFQNIFSIFPMIAAIIVIISFLEDNENIIRFIGIVSALCWLFYAIVYKSYISIVFELITLVDVCIALLKNTKTYEK